MDGELWQFGKLVGNEFTKSKLRITITDLDKIFGTISFLLSSKRETDLNSTRFFFLSSLLPWQDWPNAPDELTAALTIPNPEMVEKSPKC
ncbi:hypothetical protein [Okeania sp. SIO2C9]|uniref:hypothetical protein n=1 Tax=Okeania sp. SIO2C9 TaxID=2607791 RepID=UPI0025EAA280|nr:hypothetical protein [Okeania sp. SIO2C9]